MKGGLRPGGVTIRGISWKRVLRPAVSVERKGEILKMTHRGGEDRLKVVWGTVQEMRKTVFGTCPQVLPPDEGSRIRLKVHESKG